MSYLNLPSKPTLDRERSEVLQQWENWLEMPMLVLSFAWLGLFIVELVWGLNSLLEAIGTTIWIVFIVDFGIKFILAPQNSSLRRIPSPILKGRLTIKYIAVAITLAILVT
jgi:voltage-gated potassium channel